MHFSAPDGNMALWFNQFAVLEWQPQCSLIHRELESHQNNSNPAGRSCKFGQINPKESFGDLTILDVIGLFDFLLLLLLLPAIKDILFWTCQEIVP